MKEKCVTWSKQSHMWLIVGFYVFLPMMKRLIRHPYVLVQRFKNTSLPTNVYLDDLCPITQSQPGLLRPPRSRTCNSCKSHIVQAFIQTSDVWGVPEWANTFFALKRCADTQQNVPPSSPVFVPNIQHPLSYLLSSLIYILTHERDLLWWQRSHFSTLRTISPLPESPRSTAGIVRYPTKCLFILYPLGSGISLCFIAGVF